jgi:signal transduction histidine kinase
MPPRPAGTGTIYRIDRGAVHDGPGVLGGPKAARVVVLRYGVAVLTVAGAILVSFFDRDFSRGTPFLLFFPVPLLAFLCGGLGPGLLAAALSGFAVDYLLLPPYYSGAFHQSDVIRIAIFVGSQATLCLLLDSRNNELRRGEAQLHTIVDSVADGVVVSDLKGHQFYWNRAAVELHGFASTEDCRRHVQGFADTFGLSDMGGTILPVDQWPLPRILRGEHLRECEVRIRRINGDWQRVFSYGGTLVRDSHDQPKLAVVTLTDITERKRAEEEVRRLNAELERRVAERTAQLQAANDELQKGITERKRAEEEIRRYAEDLKRSNQELEHFAHVASHDLQEPLRAVSSFSQLLARRYQGQLDTDADEFIAFIVEGVTRMQALINDLLALSRIGTRGNPFALVDCAGILQAAKADLDVAIAASGTVITHDPLPTLRADPAQLTQLVQNLLSNAIKFRRPEDVPRIHVSAARQDGAWRFSVRDNGIGIEPQYFDRIFIIFQRLHGGEEYPGTGIGLAICRKIVERHGGRIWVESEPGGGSTFSFTIPEE